MCKNHIKRITIKDIARALGIHHTTVSRALHNPGLVKEATRKQVIAYARKHGYQVNLNALNLRGKVKNVLAIIVPSFSHQFFANIVGYFTDLAYHKGLIVSIFQSNENLEQEKEIIKTVIQNNVAGVLASISLETFESTHFAILRDYGIPLVFFDRVLEDLDVPKVTVNNADIAMAGIEILVRRNCRRIAHIAGPKKINVFRERQKGYQRAIKKLNLAYEQIIEVPRAFTIETGIAAVEKLFGMNPKPDALLLDSFTFLVGAAMQLQKYKVNIPEEIQLLAFSNNDENELLKSKITSIVQPDKEIAETAFAILMKAIAGAEYNSSADIELPARIE